MKFRFLLLLMASSLGVFGQKNMPGTQLVIKKTNQTLNIDGVLDEPAWQDAAVATFFLNYPVDSTFAPYQTEARVTFNDHFFYVSFVCHDDDKPYIVQTLKRDFDFDNNDNVSIMIGPYNDKQNGFFFIVTPYGVQMEGTIASGGVSDNSFSSDWDNRWFSKATRHDDKWVAEIAIPFKSFRYKAGEWNVNFLRWDRKHNTASNWVAVPIQFSAGAFAYSGQLIWDSPPPKPSMNVSLIPYVSGITSHDTSSLPVNLNKLQFGGDAKIGVTPSMNLDLTFNPDFSQVDVDQQVVNLTRFEYQFPERRQFFLENSDLFNNAGFPISRLFFSRRIGIASDPHNNGNLKRVPIAFGARLSGSINKKWRVSAMDMRTKEKRDIGLPSQNYTVATLLRNFGHQSSVAFTYVDKSSLGLNHLTDSTKYYHDDVLRKRMVNNVSTPYFNKYSRAYGLDLELLSKDNKWSGSSYYTLSQNPFISGHNQAYGAFGSFTNRPSQLFAGFNVLGQNYNSEAGFVPAHSVYPGQWFAFASVNFNFYPKKYGIAIMGPQSNFQVTHTPSGTLTDQNYQIGYNVNFKNSISGEVNWLYTYTRLTQAFNPINLFTETQYSSFNTGDVVTYHQVNAKFKSNQRKIVNFNAESTYGQYFNGTALNVRGQFNVRYQPYATLGIRVDYNDVRLAQGYGKGKFFVLAPRLDITMTNQLFFTTFFQYNNARDNMALNARLQWRYKPASDFFLVYSENYLPENFKSKNRALVFKFTYWLNM